MKVSMPGISAAVGKAIISSPGLRTRFWSLYCTSSPQCHACRLYGCALDLSFYGEAVDSAAHILRSGKASQPDCASLRVDGDFRNGSGKTRRAFSQAG